MRKTKRYSRKILLIPILTVAFGGIFFINPLRVSAEIIVQHIEAESGQIIPPMRTINNNLGVLGYIQTSELIGGCNYSYPSGSAVFNITVPESGFYKMRARALALWDNNDSFYFKIDDFPTDNYNRGYIWDLYNVYLPEGSLYNPSSSDWRIQDIRARDNNDNSSEYFSVGYPYEFYLSSGNHEITFYGREYTDIQRYTDPNYRCSSATGELTAKLDWFELIRIDDVTQNIKKWEPYEIRLISVNNYVNAYVEDVVVTATFTHSTTSQQITAKGFWNGKNFDGKDRFIVRFTPTEEGIWDYIITNNKNDNGLNRSGSFSVLAANSGNHGFVRVDKDNSASFVYDDGTRYLMFGTTAYNIMNNVLDQNQREHWRESIDYFSDHGINKIRFLIVPFYKMSFRNAEYDHFLPFETNDADRLNPTRDEIRVGYWQQVEELVKYMGLKGIFADIILFTNEERSFGPDSTSGDAQDDRYARYAVNRFAAYPNVIWDLANEWDYRIMNDGSVERAGNGARKISAARWNQIGNIVYTEDPWHVSKNGHRRPLSIHEGDPNYTPGIFDFFDSGWASHAILQVAPYTVDANKSAFLNLAPYTFNPVANVYGNYAKSEELGNFSILPDLNRGMPVVNDEYGYVADDFNRDSNRKAMWGIYAAGGYASMGDSHTMEGQAYKCDTSDLWALANKNFKIGNYYDGDSTSRYPNGCGTNMGATYDDVKRLIDFFATKGIEYWKMKSNNALINSWNLKHVYTLANSGIDYVVYAADGGLFTIDLESGKTYSVAKFDPRAGVETILDPVAGGLQTFNTEDTLDWVYRIRVTSRDNLADVNSDGSVDSIDITLCVNVILEIETDPAIAARAKAVAEPSDSCNVFDLQAIVNEILK